MKRLEFSTREFPNYVQIREVHKFSIYMLNDEVCLTLFYQSGAQEYKYDLIEFKVIELSEQDKTL